MKKKSELIVKPALEKNTTRKGRMSGINTSCINGKNTPRMNVL